MPEMKSIEKIHLSNRVRYRTIGEDGVLVHPESGRVLVVNEVGIFIVEILGRRDMTFDELTDEVTSAFEVDRSQAKADVTTFLDQLSGEQVVEVINVSAADHGSG